MWIPDLNSFLLRDLPSNKLYNTTVVVDAETIFSNVPTSSHAIGSQSDKIANATKNYLMKFQKANLDCYFVFKGEIDDNKIRRHRQVFKRFYMKSDEYADDIIMPLLIKDIWFQTIDEMGFKYIISTGDHVTECIALALKLSCPLIANHQEYFFSQVQYVSELETKLDTNNNLLCQIHTLSSFLEKYNMTEEKVILLIMLTDRHLFNENRFKLLFLSEKILPSYRSGFLVKLVNWIAQNSAENVMKEVRICFAFDMDISLDKKAELEKLMLKRKNIDTKMTIFVTDKNKCQFNKSDPDWFEKGIFCKYIPIPYIDLYKSKTITVHQENLTTLSVVQYAFDLLTNFKGKLNVKYIKIKSLKCESSILKPEYEAIISVFENGWEDIKQLQLFEHFVTETLQTFDFERLDKAPADCRLLLIALVYFSRKKPDVKLEVYSILLSYVMLSVVTEKLNKDGIRSDQNTEQISERPFIDSFTDTDLVTATDCDIARSIMDEYFDFSNEELSYIFNCNRNALQPLTEFQHCLQELNNLNQLCGSQFDQTVYRKTYNGTFVYKILHAMKESGDAEQDGFQFIQNKLSPAPTVLAFLSGILGIYESIYYDYN